MGLLTKLQNRLELVRLEKKYTTRRKAGPSAQYVDGEYIYQTADSSSSSDAHDMPQLTSSSAAYAASQRQHQRPLTSPTPVSFTSAPAPSSACTTNPHHGSGGPTKHSSWQSSTPSSFAASARNSTLTAPDSPATSPAISRNSRGQSWEPPKQGWGGDGTDAFKEDKREFRFDVEKDRMSMGVVD